MRARGPRAILSDNRPEWLFADLGAQGLGARGFGIYQTNPAGDVADVLSHSESKVLFCEDQEQVDKAIEVAEETPSVSTVVVLSPGGRSTTRPQAFELGRLPRQGREALAEKPSGWLRIGFGG